MRVARALIGVLLLVAPAAQPVSAQVTQPSSTVEVARRVAPALVRVLSPGAGGAGVRTSTGVLTTAHAVGPATVVLLVTNNGERVTARVVRTDAGRDLALLSSADNLPPLELEPAATQHQGDQILVFGYQPELGDVPTVSRGLISAIRLGDRGLDLIQVDTVASSGSPIVNARGKLIGLESFSQGEGLQFAIAVESINQFLAGAPALAGTPWTRDAGAIAPVVPPPSSTTPFAGSPEDVTIRPDDLGPGWTVSEQARDAADDWTTGGLRVRLQHTNGALVDSTTWVVRSREQALEAWKSTSGSSLETCQASVYSFMSDSRLIATCLVENVIIEVAGAPFEVTRTALGAAAERVRAAVEAQPSAAGGE